MAGEQCRECKNNPTNVIMVASRGYMALFYPDRYTGCLGGCEVDLLRVLGVNKLNSGNMVAGGAEEITEKVGGGEVVEMVVKPWLWEGTLRREGQREEGGAGRGRGRGHGGHESGYGSNTQEGKEVTCQCSQPPARRIVQKEGNNQGREFYCCPRPREE